MDDQELQHIASELHAACERVGREIDAGCIIQRWQIAGTVIDALFVVGMKYGRTEWYRAVIEPPPVVWPPKDTPMTTEYKQVRYQAVRVVGPIYHPISREFWQELSDVMVTHFLEHNNGTGER